MDDGSASVSASSSDLHTQDEILLAKPPPPSHHTGSLIYLPLPRG